MVGMLESTIFIGIVIFQVCLTLLCKSLNKKMQHLETEDFPLKVETYICDGEIKLPL